MSTQLLLSHAEYERFLAQPDAQGRRFELINGEIAEKMPTFLHGEIAGLIFILLRQYLLENGLGRVSVEARYRPDDDSANDFIPDVSFVRDAARIPQEGAILGMPDLAIEILSPQQSEKALLDKALAYLGYGAGMVWLVYPRKRLLEVLTNEERLLLTEGDTLTGGALLPGFSTPIRALFTP